MLLSVLKAIGGPGSLGFFCALLVLGLIWRRVMRRHAVLSWSWIVAVVIGYVVLAMPVVATAIAARLPTIPPNEQNATVFGTLVVFGGDNIVGRTERTVEVVAQSPPNEVWLLNANAMRDDLIMAGLPRNRIHIDSSATNTADQVNLVAAIMHRGGPVPCAIVASRLQVPRISAMLRAGRINATLIPSPLDHEVTGVGLRGLMPSWWGLTLTRDAVYEHAALAYHAWRGDFE